MLFARRRTFPGRWSFGTRRVVPNHARNSNVLHRRFHARLKLEGERAPQSISSGRPTSPSATAGCGAGGGVGSGGFGLPASVSIMAQILFRPSVCACLVCGISTLRTSPPSSGYGYRHRSPLTNCSSQDPSVSGGIKAEVVSGGDGLVWNYSAKGQYSG
ncbi:unnamed protein product [Heligmosomoides polygyrus]|uniref:Uncharacterized protein n=1 Tax=Heligmosomoides polygyrus TaxID=6339 RepID=A0A183GMM3_HELPZ|nr:unnamed protein product [Heligmosomoides polygyrus]